MDTGLKVSLAGHGAVLLAALIGWPFASDPESVPESVSVTLVAPEDLPRPGATEPPRAPEPDAQSAALPPAAREAPPQPPARPAPEPEPMVEPIPEPPAERAPPPPPIDRVAPVPQPAPPEDLPEAEIAREAVTETPDPAPQAVEAEPQEAVAPEAAAPEIVTEATETSEAPVPAPRADLRPQVRPSRPDPEPPRDPQPERQPDPEPTPQQAEAPAEPEVEDAVAAALAEALGGASETAPEPSPQASGPPLTRGERDGLRVSVSRCWNFAALSTDAAAVTVVVGMDMARDGTATNVRLLSHSGGGNAAAQQAFEAARRAVLRCQPYALPSAKYDQWQRIEMTFNPEEMRRR